MTHVPKHTLMGFAILLAGLAGILYLAATERVATPALTALTLPALGPYVEHAAYYDISAGYPTTTPLTASANAAALARIRSAVLGIIEQFKSDGDFAHFTAQDIHRMGFDQGRRESLEIVYLISSSPHTLSYLFTTYADTLGAHPNTFFTTLTFDTASGALLALSDLFESGSDYLGTFSKLARQMLPAVIGPGASTDFIDPGTTPDEKNFQNFFFDNKDFVLLFPPYQVAPYSDGPQTLRIPASELKNILKPGYP
ncbi:DUF3298 domain-containing protein [Candidatus Kaiserbacteria bacterium]|nr:DUF3298 domain-containing protein [Candidatus Kaiserbacteria bacterium]